MTASARRTTGRANEPAGAGVYQSTDEIRDLVLAFEATSLPYARWTHAAHLTVALWYLAWYGPDDVLTVMRRGLVRYNAAHADEPMRVGYHETMTRFWLGVVQRYLTATPFDRSLADLANGLIAAHTDRELPFAYYTRDRLMSDEARRGWVEPDRAPWHVRGAELPVTSPPPAVARSSPSGRRHGE